ncbi:MAG: hypothetical protein OHK0047_27080 [Leptolyngbyaceae cyanobacterium]
MREKYTFTAIFGSVNHRGDRETGRQESGDRRVWLIQVKTAVKYLTMSTAAELETPLLQVK